jgi:integrase
MKATLFLDKPDSTKPTRILLAISNQYSRIKLPTGEKIEPRYWNKKQKNVRSNYPFATETNQRLKNNCILIEAAAQQLIDHNVAFTREALLDAVKHTDTPGAISFGNKKQKCDFFAFINQFIADSESGKRLIDGHRLSLYTVKGYKVTRNHLLNFQKESRRKLSFDTLDSNFYDSFINYFYNKTISVKDKIDPTNTITTRGHTINSAGKHIKNLKVFAREAHEQGIEVHPDLSKRRFKVVAEDTDQIALNVDELKQIAATDLSNSKRLDHVRDCFLLAAFTGLRFSDLQQLTQQNIIGGSQLKVTTQKTGQKVVIPLHPVVRGILEKNNGIPPIPISNQKMNAYIKEVAARAGITDKITVGKTRAGSKELNTLPKHNLVTVHTARRSFATNLYLAGMDVLTIKKMTAHHTEKSFLKYIRVSEEENAARAAKHAFFQ